MGVAPPPAGAGWNAKGVFFFFGCDKLLSSGSPVNSDHGDISTGPASIAVEARTSIYRFLSRHFCADRSLEILLLRPVSLPRV